MKASTKKACLRCNDFRIREFKVCDLWLSGWLRPSFLQKTPLPASVLLDKGAGEMILPYLVCPSVCQNLGGEGGGGGRPKQKTKNKDKGKLVSAAIPVGSKSFHQRIASGLNVLSRIQLRSIALLVFLAFSKHEKPSRPGKKIKCRMSHRRHMLAFSGFGGFLNFSKKGKS